MLVRRIDPARFVVSHINDIADRLKEVETKPSGNIVIRDTLTTTDPVTGVSTVIGQQSDGTVGLNQWVGDLVPPNQPSNPLATDNYGIVTISWDGRDTLGNIQPPDYDRTAIEMAAVATGPWVEVGNLYNNGSLQLAGLTTNVIKYFRLVSIDLNGNRSVPSLIVTVIPSAIADDPSISAIIQTSASGKNSIRWQATEPSGTGYTIGDIWFQQTSFNAPITGEYMWDGDSWEPQTMSHQVIASVDLGKATVGLLDGVYIKGRTITANHLEADLILTSKVTAGDPLGTHAEMDPSGFSVFTADAVSGIPNEVIRLGAVSDADYFTLVKADGSVAASISQDGLGSFSDVSVDNDITVGGISLAERLGSNPQSLVAWGQVLVTSNMALTGAGEIGLFEIAFDTTQDNPSRMYEFNVNNFLLNVGGAGIVGLRLRFTIDGTPPDITSPVIGYNYFDAPAAGLTTSMNFTRLIGSNQGFYIRVLVCLYSLSPAVSVYIGSGSAQGFLYSSIKDLGLLIADTAVANTGGGGSNPSPPAPTPVVNYTKTYSATGSRSYLSTGAVYNYNPGYMYSGLSPAGYGDLKSMAIFPSMTGDLAGSTVTSVRVYIYYDWWYYNSGGTAKIGVHGNSTLPSTMGAITLAITSANWPKPGGRWVTLPSSLWNGFKTGQWKGITLGGTNGGYIEYGYAHGLKIEVKYTK